MKRKFVQIAALCLSVVLLAASGGRQSARAASTGTSSGRVIRVGLHHDGPYGTGAVEGLELENGTGSGFRFGYYDASNRFVLLGVTGQKAISVVKTVNVYYGTYNGNKGYHSALTTSDIAVGVFHLQLKGTYATFAKARAAAAAYQDEGGFPAWIGGEYVVRIGNYTTRDRAVAVQAALGVETTIKGTSIYGVNVVVTGTNTILFQFDDQGKGTGLGVEPNAVDIPDDDPENTPDVDPESTPDVDPENTPSDDPENTPSDDPENSPEDEPEGVAAYSAASDGGAGGVKYTTWSKDRLYYGGFRFERINGGNMTVVNILDLEDYLKGVVPQEMSDSWPLEALKAQAVVARSYTVSLGTRHSSTHFDLCSNTHCQAYTGLTRAGNNSDAAVEQTAGQVVLYNNKVAQTYYYASNGGASESVSVVWGSNQASYPYLVGKEDPYEASININNSYTRTFSSDALVAAMKKQGYNEVGTSIVSVAVVSLTEAGNPKQVAFTDNYGTRFTLNTQTVVTMLGLNSYRYGIAPAEAPAPEVSVNGSAPVDITGLYALDGDGNLVSVAGDSYVLTGSGMVQLAQDASASTGGGIGELGSTTASNGMFTFIGRGSGHNVGMSQWGAYAMAKQEFTYKDILRFYYTGVEVGFM